MFKTCSNIKRCNVQYFTNETISIKYADIVYMQHHQ